MRVRSISDGPFCWQGKEARRLIRHQLDGSTMRSSVLGVYDALTENASDKASDTFVTKHDYIASLSGYSEAQVKRVLPLLVEFGLLKVETPKLRGPCTYTLLALPELASALPEPAIARTELTLAQTLNKRSGATIEESLEEHSEEQMKLVNSPAAVSPASRNVCDADWLKEIAASAAYAGIAIPVEFDKMRLWCEQHRKLPSRKRFIAWLNRIERPMASTASRAPVTDKPAWLLEAEAMVQAMRLDSLIPSSVATCRDAILIAGREAVNWLNSTLSQEERAWLLTEWKVNHKWQPML